MPWAAAHSRTAAGLGPVRGTGPRTMLHLMLRADQSHHFYQFAGVGARATRCPLLIYQSNLRRRSLILT